jgi:hypothetical protein
MKEFILNKVYKTASTVEDGIDLGIPLIFTDKKKALEVIKKAAHNFNRHTLLHHYIKDCFLMDIETLFLQRPEDVIWDVFEMGFLENQFYHYDIEVDFLKIKYDEDGYPITSKSRVQNWYKLNKKKFELLAAKLCDDVFHVLFSNRILLQQFNIMVSENFEKFMFSKNELTVNGKIKRVTTPLWVKKAVYLRDKARCVICTTDLSFVINKLETQNFDHIVPLDLFGVNAPTNIQLLCKKCNSEKLNRNTNSSSIYEHWFN